MMLRANMVAGPARVLLGSDGKGHIVDAAGVPWCEAELGGVFASTPNVTCIGCWAKHSPVSTEQRISQWREQRWPKPGGSDMQDAWDALKVVGEAGELAEAVTKMAESRHFELDLREEIGDVLISLSVIAGRHGWELEYLRDVRWEEVKQR